MGLERALVPQQRARDRDLLKQRTGSHDAVPSSPPPSPALSIPSMSHQFKLMLKNLVSDALGCWMQKEIE